MTERICGTNMEYRVDAGAVLRVSTLKVKNWITTKESNMSSLYDETCYQNNHICLYDYFK